MVHMGRLPPADFSPENGPSPGLPYSPAEASAGTSTNNLARASEGHERPGFRPEGPLLCGAAGQDRWPSYEGRGSY